MPIIKEVPSLHIYRQVTNISLEQIQDLQSRVRQELGSGGRRRVLFNTDLKANILAAGQLVGFFTAIGKIATHDEVDNLADHLADHLPDSFDVSATAETYPLQPNIYKHSRKPHSLSLAADNQVVAAETASATQLIYELYGAEGHTTFEEAWPPRPYFNQVHLLRSYDKQALEDARALLTENSLLPSVIEFDQGSIEDAAFTAHYSDTFLTTQ